MNDKHINDVRAFNRFYTVFMGILNRSFLKSKYSLPETRVIHAIDAKPGIMATEIIALLNIDKSYLSRMIIKLEKEKLITKKKSKTDRRLFNLYITSFGKKELEKLNEASNKKIGSILVNLTEEKRRELTKSMFQIERILSGV